MSMSIVSSLIMALSDLRRQGNKQVELSVVQVVLGEVDKIKGSTGNEPSDEQVASIIRKIIEANNETIGHMKGRKDKKADINKLQKENSYLSDYLPKTLSLVEIIQELDAVEDKIKDAKNDGAATGVAMKHLKKNDLSVLGKDVSLAVKKIREG